VRKLAEVAERSGVRVVAKGVQRVSTMETLWAAGVQCMQGCLIGSPAPDMVAQTDYFTEASHGASSYPPEPATQRPQPESPVH
jgi:EAL domain-containing protein (putative c-di-GMP-specific phosphodiesterase class I)